jgi:hypothetical protein
MVGMFARVFVGVFLLLDKGILVYGCGTFNLSTGVVRFDHWSG